VVTRGSIAPAQLACSTGGWLADLIPAFLFRAPQGFAYQWSRDGADISGATSSSYLARVSGSYSCQVTAANAAGTASQTSVQFTVSSKPRVTITKARINRGRQTARFKFKATPRASRFQCALVEQKHGKKKPNPQPKFHACQSPKTYKHLKRDKYTFEVRALSAAGPGPIVKRSFRI
jgi:hypothetical protein